MKTIKLSLAISFFISIFLLVSCKNDKEDIIYGNQDCSDSTKTAGPKFNLVNSLVQQKCVSCHSDGGTPPNLNTKCNVVNYWESINRVCVINKTMPKAGPLSSSDQQLITDWVNAGHLYTN